MIWKERLELSIKARGLYGHLDGTTVRPNAPPTRPVGSETLTMEEVSQVDKYTKDVNQYLLEQAIVLQQIASTIPDSLYLKIKGKTTVKEAWEVLTGDFEKRSRMITIELRRKLHDVRCAETGNVRVHFDNVQTMREELGTSLSEQDFFAIILGSLPKSYDQFISAVIATASVLEQELNPDDLMQIVVYEYDRRSTRPGVSKERNNNVPFYAGGHNNCGGRDGKKQDKDLECFNCHKKGHKKADCWTKGGGKEGQGPRSKGNKGNNEAKKEVAAAVGEEGDGQRELSSLLVLAVL